MFFSLKPITVANGPAALLRTALLRTALLRSVVVALIVALLATQAVAQSPPQADQPTATNTRPELASPRATLATFLRTVRDKETDGSLSCIDLGGLSTEAIQTGGPGLVYQLKVAIDRFVDLRLPAEGAVDQSGPDAERWRAIPEANAYAQPYPLSEIDGASPVAKVLVLRRGEEGDWRFSRDTRLAVEALYAEIEQEQAQSNTPLLSDNDDNDLQVPLTIRLRQWFSPWLTKTHFLIPDYQWLCLLALIFVGLLADLVTRGLLTVVGDRFLASFIRIAPAADDEQAASTRPVWRPMGRLVNAAVWYQGATVVGLPPAALSVLLAILQLFTIVAAAWTAFTVIDLLARYLGQQASKTSTKFDDLVVPLATRTLKLFTVAVSVLTAAQAFDLPVLGLVSGLGLGGAALALASKDAVSNFFGSVTVLFDRPFEVGDWIITDGAEGTVEAVGFRSTRIRTFYNSLITLPNSQLTTTMVDNMGRRRFRRIKATLGLEYGTTPEQLDAFCEGVRELIRNHPHTRKDSFYVCFHDFGPSSLNVLLYCFLQAPDWGLELQEKHRLFADILRVAEQLGVSFAFPTQTLYLNQASGGEQPTGLPPEIATNPQQAGRNAAAAALSLNQAD